MSKRQIKREMKRSAAHGRRLKLLLPEIKKLPDFVARDVQARAAMSGKPVEDDFHVYQMGRCRVFVGHSHVGWHLSISHTARNPTWDEIKAARYGCCPNDVTMAVLLPPEEEYVNVDEHCFHLWEVPLPQTSEE